MLGQATANSMVVWGRTSEPGEFTVHYGKNPDRFDQVGQPGTTAIDRDNTGTVTLTDLQPDTRYYYQVWVENHPHGLPGSFLTLPNKESSKNDEHNPNGLFNFRFQIGSCANQNPLNGAGHRATTYEHVNQDWAGKAHFHIMNGDWLYEELRAYPPEAWRLVQGLRKSPLIAEVMPTIIGVWKNYKLYLSRGVELAKWHRNVPSYFTFDDHELVNDIWGSGEAGKQHRQTVFRDIGTQAWFDYLGWANPMEHKHPILFGKASMKSGSDLLTDTDTDFNKLPFNEMLNLHVHWGTPDAGVNDMIYDNEEGHPNSYVYERNDCTRTSVWFR